MDSGPRTTPKGGPSYKRRPHKKSKTGCTECRKRRVKCSEERPRCRSCVRHGVACCYPEPAASARAASSGPAAWSTGDAPARELAASRQHNVGTTPIPSPSASATPCNISETKTFGMADLALLHHWTVSASLSIVSCHDIDRIWQVVFPQVAFHHPFVMHAIMGLAALHLAHAEADRETRRKHTIDAVRHHNEALQGFRGTINRPSDENADALFACSTLNIIYVFGVSDMEGASSSRKSRVLGAEWIPMVRGVRAVLPAVLDRVLSGPLRELISLGAWDDADPDRDTTAEDQRFRALRTAWANSGGDDDTRVYDETLYQFRKSYLYLVRGSSADASSENRGGGFNRAWAGPIIFLFMAPQEYLTRLHQRQPAALVIFAHFGAVLHNLKQFWFLDGWARDIVEVVDDILGDYWKPWTAWPREVVGLV